MYILQRTNGTRSPTARSSSPNSRRRPAARPKAASLHYPTAIRPAIRPAIVITLQRAVPAFKKPLVDTASRSIPAIFIAGEIEGGRLGGVRIDQRNQRIGITPQLTFVQGDAKIGDVGHLDEILEVEAGRARGDHSPRQPPYQLGIVEVATFK